MALDKTPAIKADNRTSINTGKVKRFTPTIKGDTIDHIITRLTELYSNPLESAVRETLTNAYDSVSVARRSGLNVPEVAIEVNFPNIYSDNIFKVTDYGLGMTMDELENTFFNYDNSNKGDDLEQVGAYGLGAKAPLAYTSEFYVDTVKDNVKISALFTKKDDAVRGFVTEVSDTDEPNKTVVSFPVKPADFDSLQLILDSYRMYSVDEKIMIENVTYELSDNLIPLGDIIIEEESNTVGRLWFDMNKQSHANGYNFIIAGAKYGVSFYHGYSQTISGITSSNNVSSPYFIELKPGVVNFPSSREKILQDDKLTKLVYTIAEQLTADNLARRFIKHVYSKGDEGVLTTHKILAPHTNRIGSAPKWGDDVRLMMRIGNRPEVCTFTKKELESSSKYSFEQLFTGKKKVITALWKSGKTFSPLSNIYFQYHPYVSESTKIENMSKVLWGNALSFAVILRTNRLQKTNIVFVTTENQKEINRFNRIRNKFSDRFNVNTFVLLKEAYTDDEKEITKKLINADEIKYYNVDEMIDLLPKSTVKSPTNRATKNERLEEVTYYTTKTVNSVRDIYSKWEAQNTTLSKLIAEDNTVFVFHHYDARSAVEGYIKENMNELGRGRKFVVVGDSRKDIITSIPEGRVIFSENFRNRAPSLNGLVRANTFASPGVSMFLDMLTLEELCNLFTTKITKKTNLVNFYSIVGKDISWYENLFLKKGTTEVSVNYPSSIHGVSVKEIISLVSKIDQSLAEEMNVATTMWKAYYSIMSSYNYIHDITYLIKYSDASDDMKMELAKHFISVFEDKMLEVGGC